MFNFETIQSTTLSILNSRFNASQAEGSGGILALAGTDTVITLTNFHVDHSSSITGEGGALFLSNSRTTDLTITDSFVHEFVKSGIKGGFLSVNGGTDLTAKFERFQAYRSSALNGKGGLMYTSISGTSNINLLTIGID